MYKSRQRIFERKKDGGTYIPRDAWGSIKRAHDDLVRRLINLPMHVLIIAQEKPLYQKVGNDMEVVGFTIDADKKDEYMFDTVARFFVENGVRCAGIDKDRTQRTKTLDKIENPTFSLWASSDEEIKPDVMLDREVTVDDLEIMISSAGDESKRKRIAAQYKPYIDALDDEDKERVREAWRMAKEAEAAADKEAVAV